MQKTMLPKEKMLTEFVEKLGKSFVEDYVDRLHFLTTQALEERAESVRKEVQNETSLTKVEIETNQRILRVFRDQFTCYYQEFHGTFEEWLELRGLAFVEDKFLPVDVKVSGAKSVSFTDACSPKLSDAQMNKALLESLRNLSSFLEVKFPEYFQQPSTDIMELVGSLLMELIAKRKYISSLPDCMQKIKPGEPVFVLRGQDKSASDVVAYWVAANVGETPIEKIEDAVSVAVAMKNYPRKKQAD